MEFIIVCPLVFIAGFIDAIAGGGGLVSLPAYLIAGVPVHTAIGTNKLSSGMGTTVATWQYWKSGYIPWKQAIICCIVALFASALGANLTLLIKEDFLRIVLLIILPVTAIYLMFHKDFGTSEKDYPKNKVMLLSMLTSFCVGVYDGFYGPGTGTFLLLLLTGFAGMKLTTANGIAKTINLSTNIAALAVMLVNGKVFLLLGLTAGLFNMLGNYIGTKFFKKGGVNVARPVIILVITIFLIKTIIEII